MPRELTNHEKDLLLMVLKHYLSMDIRAKVMAQIPNVYNAWVGQDVMSSVRNSDGKVYK